MKTKLIAALAVAPLLVASQTFAQETPPAKKATPVPRTTTTPAPKSKAAMELQGLVGKVQTKMAEFRKEQAGKEEPAKITAKDLDAELKAFDAALESHKGEKTDDVAQILSTKSTIYSQVLGDYDKAIAVTEQLKTEFPDTRQGKMADKTIENLKKAATSAKVREGLVVGAKFPDFDEKDLHGKPLSIAGYKGKVVLIDFWATWCGPCVKELPHVLEAYTKYHKDGFEIIGISLDREGDKEKLEKFIADKNMPWQQYFDGGFWQNKLSTKYGVNSIPATYLLDGEGKIIGKNLRGDALSEAVGKALKKS